MDLEKKAKLRAMHLLTTMDRTEKQLTDSLRRTGYPAEVIAATVEYVKSFGYINDAEYARRYLECYRDRKSVQRIRQDLTQKGVGRELIDAAFEDDGSHDETELIRTLLHKRWQEDRKPDEKELKRLVGYLARQGFSNHDIWCVLREENLT